MSTQKKDKKIGGDVKGTPSKVAGGAASKNELRTKLESILSVPMMKILSQYTEDEVMTLFGKLKDAYDVVHTRTLLLPRDKRLTDEQKALMAAIADEEGGVVEGEEDEEDEDDEMLSQESESDEEEDGKIGEIMQLFKQRLILNEIFERESTHDEDYMDEDELDALEEEEAAEESEEDAPAPKKAAKVTKKGSVKVEELSDEEDDEEDEEDEEEGEFDDEMGDGLAQSRQFFASFSLLDADGNVVASNIELESNDLFTHPGFEGEHSLTWDEDPILTLNTVDGDIIEPEGPSFEELQAALESDEDFDEEILGAGVPNTWDADVAEALKIKAGFPEDLTPLQFIVIMLRVMSRIVKNAARSPGPAPADGLLPYLALELSNHIEEEELAEDAEGMEVDDEEESEEEVPAPKKKNAAPAPVKKEQNNKPHHDGKKDHKPHHDGKKDHKPHHDGKKDHKPHHDGKKDHKPHHDGKKDHKPHQNNKDQNNKKRPNITGGHSESTQQHKKHKK